MRCFSFNPFCFIPPLLLHTSVYRAEVYACMWGEGYYRSLLLSTEPASGSLWNLLEGQKLRPYPGPPRSESAFCHNPSDCSAPLSSRGTVQTTWLVTGIPRPQRGVAAWVSKGGNRLCLVVVAGRNYRVSLPFREMPGPSSQWCDPQKIVLFQGDERSVFHHTRNP